MVPVVAVTSELVRRKTDPEVPPAPEADTLMFAVAMPISPLSERPLERKILPPAEWAVPDNALVVILPLATIERLPPKLEGSKTAAPTAPKEIFPVVTDPEPAMEPVPSLPILTRTTVPPVLPPVTLISPVTT